MALFFRAAGLPERADLVETHRPEGVPLPHASRAAGAREPGIRGAGRPRLERLRQPPRAQQEPHRHLLGGDGDVPEGELRAHPRVQRRDPRTYRREGCPRVPAGTVPWAECRLGGR